MTKKVYSILNMLSVLIVLFSFVVSARIYTRFDLTASGQYSLSDVSKNLYREIPDTVHIYYYVSNQLRSTYPEPDEILDFLKEYVSYAKGKIILHVQDPVRTASVQNIEDAGLYPQQIQSDAQTGSSMSVYSGIIIEYLETSAVLPFVFSVDTLEYDLSSRIRSLVRRETREVGIFHPIRDQIDQQNFLIIEEVLKAGGYTSRLLLPEAEIPSGTALLIVIDGFEYLDIEALRRIDRYILQGGSVLFALDAVDVDAADTLDIRKKQDAAFKDMLAVYGIYLEASLVLDSNSLMIPVQTRGPAGDSRVVLQQYPHWITVPASTDNTPSLLGRRFNGMDLFWASPLRVNTSPSVDIAWYAQSSHDSWLMRDNFTADPADSELFSREAHLTRGPHTVLAALSGRFPSAFSQTETAYAPEARLLVIGDSDIFSSLIHYTQSERNLEFLLTAADWLSGDDEILSISRKSARSGRLDAISDPSKRVFYILAAQLVNVLVIPLLLIGFGIYFAGKKRSRKRPSP